MKVFRVTLKSTGLHKFINLDDYSDSDQEIIINFYTFDNRYYTRLIEG